MSVDEMVEDFIKRSKIRSTSEQIKRTMELAHTLILDEGFMTLDVIHDELHCLYMYIKPGADLLPLFEFVAEEAAKHFGCTVIRFLSRRKPEAIQKTRPGYRPVSIMYERMI